MLTENIGFIGGGQMARALAEGFVRAGLIQAGQLIASDPAEDAREAFAAAVPGARVTADNAEVAAGSQVIFLAIKPQYMDIVLDELSGHVTADHLVVSIAAGVRLAALAEKLGKGQRLIRVMPNTPALVGQGASAFALGGAATEQDAALVEQLLQAVGMAFRVDEKLLDAVTGLSGSGPAFVYVMIEALSDGGVRMGLPRHIATALAAQTLRGAAEMVLAGSEHPGVLKDRVATPGGTTIAGLQALENGSLRATLIAAVEAATRRSVELGDADAS
ncbi:MAG: pyrroline-5-carboxylate reductase [Planctomycetes bacterium]|nr:pyrroline-5-carboxylate reductase [Planctomycetota bacterium]